MYFFKRKNEFQIPEDKQELIKFLSDQLSKSEDALREAGRIVKDDKEALWEAVNDAIPQVDNGSGWTIHFNTMTVTRENK